MEVLVQMSHPETDQELYIRCNVTEYHPPSRRGSPDNWEDGDGGEVEDPEIFLDEDCKQKAPEDIQKLLLQRDFLSETEERARKQAQSFSDDADLSSMIDRD